MARSRTLPKPSRARRAAPAAGFLLAASFLAWTGLGRDAEAQAPEFRWRHGGNVHGIAFMNELQGLATRDGGGALYTEDGGTWNEARVPDAVRGQLRHIFVEDAVVGRAWSVGEGGVVLRTLNRGHDWAWVNNDPLSSNSPILDKLGNKASLYDIYMWDDLVGIACGEDGALARTEDGWASWTQIALPTEFFDPTHSERYVSHPGDLYKFAVAGNGDLFLTGDFGRLLRSEDQGETFELHFHFTHYCGNPGGTVRDVELWGLSFEGSTGWLAGGFGTNDGLLWRSGNNGQSFSHVTRVVLPDTGMVDAALMGGCKLPTIYGVAAVGTSNAVAIGYAGGVWTYEDGTTTVVTPCNCTGTSTAAAPALIQHRPVSYTGTGLSPTRPPHNAVFALDGANVWWTGLFGVLAFTPDLGSTIVETSCQIPARIGAGAFRDSQVGLAVAQSHRVYRTTDGAATWTEVHQGADDTYGDYMLQYVAFSTAPSSSLAVAMGDRVLLLRSLDGGATWGELYGPHAVNHSFALAEGSEIFYVGAGNGVVWRTDLTDLDGFGALTWAMRSLPSSATNVTGLHFIDADTGYAVTDSMQLYETSSGGTSWSAVSVTGSPLPQRLNAVRTFGDASKAIAVGARGRVLVRVGLQFEEVDLSALTGGAELRSVEITDGGKQVFVGGDKGLVLHFSGTSFSEITNTSKWSAPKSQTSGPVIDLSFVGASHGFLFSPAGVVVEYD
jgi:photosystem II stability/assembly factor-like uncharacterized protein